MAKFLCNYIFALDLVLQHFHYLANASQGAVMTCQNPAL